MVLQIQGVSTRYDTLLKSQMATKNDLQVFKKVAGHFGGLDISQWANGRRKQNSRFQF